jgi:hypothetical protein
MIPSPAEAPDLYDDDDARPLRDGTSIQYTPPPWLKNPSPAPASDDA